MFNNQLSLESLLYYHGENHIGKISNIISNQGLSGFNFLENLDLNINLNKPIILYYGIMQLSVYFSNLHYDFTSCNSNLVNYEKVNELRRHGIPLKLFKNLNPTSTIEDILAIRLPVFRRGVCSRFFLAYDYKQIKHIFAGSQYRLFNSLSRFFKANLKKEFAEEVYDH